MSGGALIGIVLLVFFLAGIVVGVVVVIALSARRAREPGELDWVDGDDDDRGDDDEEPDGGPGAPPPIVSWPS